MEQWEVMEVLWTTYPPAATKLNVRHSRWVRPMSKGTEAWTMLGTSQSPHKMKHEMSENVGEIQGRIQDFQNGGGGGGLGAVEFLDLRFVLMPLHTYPMFLLE